MRIYSMQCFEGKNIYSHKPVIKMTIDIGELYRQPTREFEGFNDTLLDKLPGLYKHYCSKGYEGGFVERLREGTYIAHVIEHMALELQGMLEYEVSFGKARVITEPSVYSVIMEYANASCGLECCKAAVNIAAALIEGKTPDVGAILDNIRHIATETELGPSTRAIFDEARRRGIPVTRVGNESLLQLGYGKYMRRIQASLTDAPSCIAIDIAGNKQLTKELLLDHKIPVPYGEIAYSQEAAAAIANNIGYPVVVKPLDSSQGKGVAIELQNEAQVKAAYAEAVKHSKTVIVERFVRGKDYRILVVGNKVSAVSERKPPAVTGDGRHNLSELVEMENRQPLRGEDHEKPLTKIKLDAIAIQMLSRKGMNAAYIPRKGETVYLRDNGNLSTGGTARDCTDEIHPYNSRLAVRAARTIGLDIAGVDIVTEDISVPLGDGKGVIVEVNAAPGIRMHLYPTEGEGTNVASDILDMLYPDPDKATIPIVSITGTNGKTTTTRLVAHTVALTGRTVGMTSTSGIYINGECILKGDNTGPTSAKIVLSDKSVEAAVLETARGGIVRRGLGYDAADIGVIVNISDDHMGIDGIQTLEDLAFVKSLVVEAVKPEGYSILNADEAMIGYLLKRAAGNRILFSKRKDNPEVLKHIKSKGKAVYIEDGHILIYTGKDIVPLISLEDIPITFQGLVKCNIENSLAAAAVLYALNLPPDIIQAGLRTFKPDIASNPGRFNIFDLGNFKVMLDYSHNPPGYNAVAEFIKKMNVSRLVGVIGMPGDRLDRNISEAGKICSSVFSRLYIKEDRDRRGRQEGEVAGILYEAALKNGFKKENAEIVHCELKALEKAILDAQPGDLIVMFYEEFEPAVELVNRFKKELEQSVLQPELIMGETRV